MTCRQSTKMISNHFPSLMSHFYPPPYKWNEPIPCPNHQYKVMYLIISSLKGEEGCIRCLFPIFIYLIFLTIFLMYRFKITWIKWKKGAKFHSPFPPPLFFHFPVDLHTLQCATSATPEMIKKH